jgi:hypothetical protein
MRRNAALLVLAGATTLVASSCTDIYGIGDRDFEGFYSYAGTVDDAFGDAVTGQVTITRQRGDRADVTIDWSYIDAGVESVNITTDRAAVADISPDGFIEFEFTGDLFTGGRAVEFRLTHEGRLRGDQIAGTWRLFTGLPTTDRGAFIAER